MKELYEEALHYLKPFNTLRKIESQGRFLMTCAIRGVEFKDALCNSASCINIMTKETSKKLEIKELQPSDVQIGLADSSFEVPEVIVCNVNVRIGRCNVPTDFHVIKVEKGRPSNLILGGAFLATAGAIMDSPNRTV